MKIHAMQTGTVIIHKAQQEGKGRGGRRMLNMLFDRNWTKPLPIFAWVIEHPEGLILVDTGETAQASMPGYFPRWHPYFILAVRTRVRPEEEMGPQLSKLGISPSDVRTVIMTHLHTDHAGGLSYFPKSEILVAQGEYERAAGFKGRVNGYPSNRWPSWFNPTTIKFMKMRPEPFGPFGESLKVTRAGDVTVVPTPGHTPAHVSVAVHDGSDTTFLAGDVSYTQELMLRQRVDGVSPDEEVARDTLRKVLSFVSQQPTVYVVAHDPESGLRLAARQIVQALPNAI
jgi:N-acyl homoserine lactone hydrolase